MKILLLEHPRKIAKERCNDIANTPLSSSLITGYIAGMLSSRKHEVKIVEGYLDKLSYDQIAGIIDNFQPDILGIHIIYSWGNDGDLFSFLKENKGGSIKSIIAYGFYPTFAYSEILQQCPEIDAVIMGEPEHTFVQLAEIVQNRSGFNSLSPVWSGKMIITRTYYSGVNLKKTLTFCLILSVRMPCCVCRKLTLREAVGVTGDVLSAILIPIMGSHPAGGDEARRISLPRLIICLKDMGKGAFILLIPTFSVPAGTEGRGYCVWLLFLGSGKLFSGLRDVLMILQKKPSVFWWKPACKSCSLGWKAGKTNL
jgi:hypothetical protein